MVPIEWLYYIGFFVAGGMIGWGLREHFDKWIRKHYRKKSDDK